jgi:hypothetical protein
MELKLSLGCRGKKHFKNQIMNKFFPIPLMLFLSIGNVAPPSIAAPARSNCNGTLKSIRSSLAGVVTFKQRNIGNMGQPPGRLQSLDIIFKDEEKFPNDSNKMAIATRVIRNCPRIASVIFGIDQTDAGSIYGIKKGQIIKFASCVDAGGTKKPTWGETYCEP